MIGTKGRELRIAVVGGANIDIGGKPFAALAEGDSNPGRVRVSVGGVGRNIAHNLRLLGLPVSFLTALGRDIHGDRVAAECAMAGIDCERVLRCPEEATSTYLFIADESGEMRLAVSDMEICRRISPDYLRAQREILDSAAAVVADANLPEESLRWLAENCRAPLFADPVSAAKAGRVKPVLGRLHTLKPNALEAEMLSGVAIRSEGDLPRAAEALLEAGLKRVFISLGSRGIFAAEAGNQVRLPCCPARARNMTGAGDAMMAGLVWSWIRGMDLADSARAAAAAAAIAVEGSGTVNPALSPEEVARKIRETEAEKH